MEGIRKYGGRNWTAILRDPAFADVLASRSLHAIRDRWRTKAFRSMLRDEGFPPEVWETDRTSECAPGAWATARCSRRAAAQGESVRNSRLDNQQMCEACAQPGENMVECGSCSACYHPSCAESLPFPAWHEHYVAAMHEWLCSNCVSIVEEFVDDSEVSHRAVYSCGLLNHRAAADDRR